MKKDADFEPKNPKKRDLSSFMAEQLLYDYATKKLDPKREQAVKEALQNSPTLTKALDDIIYGMTYCHHLQKTSLSPELLDQLKKPLNFKSKLKWYFHPRTWNQGLPWVMEVIGLSFIVLVLSYSVPWPKLVTYIREKSNRTFFLTEIPKDKTYKSTTMASQINPEALIQKYLSTAELRTVNPEFTANKLAKFLPQLGASIEHQARRQSPHGSISPFFRISMPKNQTEALLTELKSQGQLTWIAPPSENEKGSMIFGMELWLTKQEPKKPKAPSKDSTEE